MTEAALIEGDSRAIDVLEAVGRELARTKRLYPDQRHDISFWLVILGEEFGEACKALYEADKTDWAAVNVIRGEALFSELTQVAAVAINAAAAVRAIINAGELVNRGAA